MKDFIDAYKHLEKICSEMYGEQHGITQYINDMELVPGGISSYIPDWYDDLNNLKRLRHIRNAMVHDSDFDEDYSKEDVMYLEDFYDRIMNCQDPLAMKRALDLKKNAKKKTVKERTIILDNKSTISDVEDEKLNEKAVIAVVMVVVLLLVVLGFVVASYLL